MPPVTVAVKVAEVPVQAVAGPLTATLVGASATIKVTPVGAVTLPHALLSVTVY